MAIFTPSLTLWRLTSYRTANLQTLHFKYLFNKYTFFLFNSQITAICPYFFYGHLAVTNILTEYFKHAAHSPFYFLFKMPFIS